jgi:hypothetical protein
MDFKTVKDDKDFKTVAYDGERRSGTQPYHLEIGD